MKTIKYISLGLLTVLGVTSCSDTFLEEKRNYDNVNKDVYNYYSGAEGRVNDIYGWCLPQVSDQTWKFPSCGNRDIAAQSTEEYSGFSDFVNPEIELVANSSSNSVPDFFQGDAGNVQESVYGRIRNANDMIRGISESSLNEEDKNKLLGQVYFFRAWCYYNLFKWYGGVPLVEEVQDPVASSFTPRSTSKQTMEFILKDLDMSAKLLAPYTMNGGWSSSSDYGRVTTASALALKGRVLLLWASPLFNRKNDQSRWSNAYSVMKTELDSIKACGNSLYTSGNNVNGSVFASVFTTFKNPEMVFGTLYNNYYVLNGKAADTDPMKNNPWERYIRPDNQGGNGLNASAMIVDMFPMADGKIPASANNYTKLETSSFDYDPDVPFMDRDPRFYRTFRMPGFRWAYQGNAAEHDPHNPSDGANYTLWNYVWYNKLSDAGDPESGNSYAADNLGSSKVGVYVCKKTDDLDCNGTPLYTYDAGGWKSGAGPFYSAAPLIEIRFTEVLLNLAEAACMSGNTSEAVSLLQQVRDRAGVPAYSNLSDQATCMSAILYERQVEFAYEGKRFDDMRRWMLFDGGATQPSGAPTTWTLTGWGGNTCTWLGFKPFNGQRRENIQFRTADKFGVAELEYGADPLLKAGVSRPEGVNLSKPLAEQLETLKTFYKENLVRKLAKGDGRNSQHVDEYINYRPKYYFLGLPSGVQNNNKGLLQTACWEDYINGGFGTFDPLAE